MRQAPEWDIVVVGGAYTDCVVRGPQLPSQGETVLGQEGFIVPGSKGSNQAVSAVRLGASRVALVARVGSDARGNEILTQLQAEHVDSRYVVCDQAVPTGMSLIQVDEHGSKQMMVTLGASHYLTEEDVQRASEAISSTRVFLTQEEAGPFASATAALTTTKLGARPALPRRAEVEDLLVRLRNHHL